MKHSDAVRYSPVLHVSQKQPPREQFPQPLLPSTLQREQVLDGLRVQEILRSSSQKTLSKGKENTAAEQRLLFSMYQGKHSLQGICCHQDCKLKI